MCNDPKHKLPSSSLIPRAPNHIFTPFLEERVVALRVTLKKKLLTNLSGHGRYKGKKVIEKRVIEIDNCQTTNPVL